MLVTILLAIVTNLAMYIIVSTISSRESQGTQKYYKDELGRTQQVIVNLVNSVKNDLLNEIKEQGDIINKMNEQINRKENEK